MLWILAILLLALAWLVICVVVVAMARAAARGDEAAEPTVTRETEAQSITKEPQVTRRRSRAS
jgi:uncharacterized protein YoxC